MLNYILVFLIAMVPLIELRGAVPFGVGMQLDLFWVYVLAILGNMLPVPFLCITGYIHFTLFPYIYST